MLLNCTIHSSFMTACLAFGIVTESPTDYQVPTTIFTFSSCLKRSCINVTIENNDNAEGTELFSVTLQRATNLDPRISLVPENQSATVQIDNDDGMLCTLVHSGFCYCTIVDVCRDEDLHRDVEL